jgi:solute carrier family 35, member F5
LTSPTVATIGTSITIPFAVITDFIINHDIPDGKSVGGAVLVIIGFVLVNVEDKTIYDLLKTTN